MNTKKIDNNIQYWHSKNEFPKDSELILIDSNNPKYKNIYFVGQSFIDKSGSTNPSNYKIRIIGLDDDNMVLIGYNNWWYNVNKWMYLTDARKILQ